MSPLELTAETEEKALKEALKILKLPEEALDIAYSQEKEEELLAGAKPFVRITASVRPEYVTDKLQECVSALLDKMEKEHETETYDYHGVLVVNIQCEEPEILIGYKGETLDALQHLVARMARLSGREIPLVLLDVDHYRRKRLDRLKKVTDDLADLTRDNGQDEPFDPMDPTERKVVHTFLKAMEGVKSYSRGEGANRHVVVAPEN